MKARVILITHVVLGLWHFYQNAAGTFVTAVKWSKIWHSISSVVSISLWRVRQMPIGPEWAESLYCAHFSYNSGQIILSIYWGQQEGVGEVRALTAPRAWNKGLEGVLTWVLPSWSLTSLVIFNVSISLYLFSYSNSEDRLIIVTVTCQVPTVIFMSHIMRCRHHYSLAVLEGNRGPKTYSR